MKKGEENKLQYKSVSYVQEHMTDSLEQVPQDLGQEQAPQRLPNPYACEKNKQN